MKTKRAKHNYLDHLQNLQVPDEEDIQKKEALWILQGLITHDCIDEGLDEEDPFWTDVLADIIDRIDTEEFYVNRGAGFYSLDEDRRSDVVGNAWMNYQRDLRAVAAKIVEPISVHNDVLFHQFRQALRDAVASTGKNTFTVQYNQPYGRVRVTVETNR